jgi:hypothetical protein
LAIYVVIKSCRGVILLRLFAVAVAIIRCLPYEGDFFEFSPACHSKACESAHEAGWKQA